MEIFKILLTLLGLIISYGLFRIANKKNKLELKKLKLEIRKLELEVAEKEKSAPPLPARNEKRS